MRISAITNYTFRTGTENKLCNNKFRKAISFSSLPDDYQVRLIAGSCRADELHLKVKDLALEFDEITSTVDGDVKELVREINSNIREGECIRHVELHIEPDGSMEAFGKPTRKFESSLRNPYRIQKTEKDGSIKRYVLDGNKLVEYTEEKKVQPDSKVIVLKKIVYDNCAKRIYYYKNEEEDIAKTGAPKYTWAQMIACDLDKKPCMYQEGIQEYNGQTNFDSSALVHATISPKNKPPVVIG